MQVCRPGTIGHHGTGPHDTNEGAALLAETRRFAVEDRGQSWLHLISTLALLSGSVALSLGLRSPPWRLGASILQGLLMVRTFALYHDVMHAALLRGSKLARALMSGFGLLVLAPPSVWRATHNYHHAHNATLVDAHIGGFPNMTTDAYRKARRSRRLAYRIARHPATILAAGTRNTRREASPCTGLVSGFPCCNEPATLDRSAQRQGAQASSHASMVFMSFRCEYKYGSVWHGVYSIL